MRFLLKLLMIPVVVVLAWGGWWFLGARAQEEAIAAWFADREQAGWQAEYAGIDVTGFPERFDRRVDGVMLTDPVQGWSLSTPWIASSSATFGPNRFTVTVPPEFSFALPGERVGVETTANRFELGVAPEVSMPLDDASLGVMGLKLSAGDWSARAARIDARIAERSTETGPDNSYDLTLEAEDVVLPESLISELDPTGRLSPEFERLTIDGHAALDHALDRDFVEAGELSARTIVLRRGAFKWGKMALDASGRLDADRDGMAEGKVSLSVTNWRQMIRMAEDAGMIGGDMAGAIEGALGLASMFGSKDGALDISLRFGDGRIWIGPVPIGDAPRISFPPRERAEG